jgi:hypothetical protein
MFHQCTAAANVLAKRIRESIQNSKGPLVCIDIHGSWAGPLPDSFRVFANASDELESKKKRDHQWLAVGPGKNFKEVDSPAKLERWYETAVTVDPTCFQFFEQVTFCPSSELGRSLTFTLVAGGSGVELEPSAVHGQDQLEDEAVGHPEPHERPRCS